MRDDFFLWLHVQSSIEMNQVKRICLTFIPVYVWVIAESDYLLLIECLVYLFFFTDRINREGQLTWDDHMTRLVAPVLLRVRASIRYIKVGGMYIR